VAEEVREEEEVVGLEVGVEVVVVVVVKVGGEVVGWEGGVVVERVEAGGVEGEGEEMGVVEKLLREGLTPS
jgi:hypothetical protein